MTPSRRRERRQARRERRTGGADTQSVPARYRMREKPVVFENNFIIETAEGTPAFKIDGKPFRMRNTIQTQEHSVRSLYRVQECVLRVKDTMVIEHGGRPVATTKKALVTSLRDRFDVKVADGPPLHVQGNVVDHGYTITRQESSVAVVSKRWFRVRDIYGVEVMPREDDAFVLAVAAAPMRSDAEATEHGLRARLPVRRDGSERFIPVCSTRPAAGSLKRVRPLHCLPRLHGGTVAQRTRILPDWTAAGRSAWSLTSGEH